MKITELTADQLCLEGTGYEGIITGACLSVGAVFWAIMMPTIITFVVAVVLGLIGLLFMLFSPWEKITANKASGEVVSQQKLLFSTTESRFGLTDVSHLEVRWKWAAQTTREAAESAPGLLSDVTMILKNGKEWPLVYASTSHNESEISAFMGQKGERYQFAGQVAEFFGVPVREVKL